VHQSRSARFRELLERPPFVCLGAHDAVTAKLAEQAGAPAIYVSGFVASAIVAGQPDFGVLTQTEMFEHIRRICRVTTLPVFADADPGYGGPLDAQRTIQLWEEAGASVLHLEDQAMPKKCGHFAGKELIPAEEMQQKLRARFAVVHSLLAMLSTMTVDCSRARAMFMIHATTGPLARSYAGDRCQTS